VRPAAPSPEILFYDGHCGLCHRAVKFVIKHDRSGRAFRFAPLHGATFRSRVPSQDLGDLPDSVVVLTSEAKLLVRSDAFVHILKQLGGGWASLGAAVAAIPRPMRDFTYDVIARIRYRVFGRRDDVCPVAAPELRERFDP